MGLPKLAGFLYLACATALTAGEGRFDWEGSESSCAPEWRSDGLRITNARGGICAKNSGSPGNGTWTSNDVAGLAITHLHGLPFTPLTIDLGEYSAFVSDSAVNFVGTKKDGTTVSAEFQLDGLLDGAGGIEDFQHYTFPTDFTDIVRMEIPNTRWAFDNFTFRTVIPPPLPTDQRIAPGFHQATPLLSKSIHETTLVIGADFSFVSGFNPDAPSTTRILPPEGNATIRGYSPDYDRAGKTLYYRKQGTGAPLAKVHNGQTSDVVSMQDMAAAGFGNVDSLTMPRAATGGMMFLGTRHGDESFTIFQHQNGAIATVVTPQSLLPDGTGGTATPCDFPRDIATRGVDFAFDTSLAGNAQTWRLFASFAGGPIIQLAVAKQQISASGISGKLRSFDGFSFTNSGALRVRAKVDERNACLFFNSSGLNRIFLTDATVSPENAGLKANGELVETDAGVTFLQGTKAIYRLHDDRWFHIIGEGDRIDGETVSMVKFHAAPPGEPLRVIVEVRYESSPGTAQLLELLLSPPVTAPPRFGAPFVHPEQGHLFIPLSHLTAGHAYRLQRSADLSAWTDLWEIESVEPLQHVVIPAELLGRRAFFRVGDR